MSGLMQSDGKASSMRAAMWLCIVISGYLAVAGLHTGASMVELSPVIFGFLASGIGGKVWQKGKE